MKTLKTATKPHKEEGLVKSGHLALQDVASGDTAHAAGPVKKGTTLLLFDVSSVWRFPSLS